MTEIGYHYLDEHNRIAYRLRKGREPGVMFLPGLKSSMDATKARFIDDLCCRTGRACLRMDYSGHGDSSRKFEDCSLGEWMTESTMILTKIMEARPQIIVGSSMGAWIALKIARDAPELVTGVVGVSSAPDFTSDLMRGMSPQDHHDLETRGQIELDSDPDYDPIILTREFLEDAKSYSIMNNRLELPMPVRLLHADDDNDVSMTLAIDLFTHARCPDITLTLMNNEGHRMSSPRSLAAIAEAIESIPCQIE